MWSYKNTLGSQPKKDYKLNFQMVLYLRGKDTPDLEATSLLEQFAHQEFDAPDGRRGNRHYKWQKPDQIAELDIRHSTREGDLVIDPFMGSGTFLLVSAGLGRRAMGCDIAEDALEIARRRGCIIEATCG